MGLAVLKGKVLFIDAKDEVTRKNAESFLEPHHIEKIVDSYNAYTDIDGFTKVVDNKTILSNRSLISIQSYVVNTHGFKTYNYSDSISEWEDQTIRLRSQMNQIINLIEHGNS